MTVKDRQTDRRTDRQTDGQRDRQTRTPTKEEKEPKACPMSWPSSWHSDSVWNRLVDSSLLKTDRRTGGQTDKDADDGSKGAQSLPNVMAKFMALGLCLEQVGR